MRLQKMAIGLVACIIFTADARAQGTAADYARAEALPGRYQNKLTHARVDPHWITDAPRF